MADYSKIGQDEFDAILAELVLEEGAAIIRIGGVYDELAEHFNNDVLDRWAERNPEKAYPKEASDGDE